MPYRVVFTGKQRMAVESFDLPPLTAQSVRARAICSLVSTGTENIVFNRLFDAGTHWDRWVKYPFYPGYAMIGRIEEVGGEVADLHVGDIVASRTPHMSEYVETADKVFPVPDGLEPRQAAWFAIAKIAGTGAMRAQHVMGDSVLVIGAGPIGQMSVRWAVATGAESVIAVDSAGERLDMARQGGATAVISKSIDDATDDILVAGHGRRPRVVIDSTGNAGVFAPALRIAADNGKVVLLGDTGMPTEQRLTSDVLRRNVSVVGAHDIHPWPGRGWAEIYRLFFQLVVTQRMNVAGLNTHVFPGARASLAYEIANTRRSETMGIVFDWTDSECFGPSSSQGACHALEESR